MWPRAENEHVVILNVMKGFSVSADARSPSSMEHGVVFRHGTWGWVILWDLFVNVEVLHVKSELYLQDLDQEWESAKKVACTTPGMMIKVSMSTTLESLS